METKNIIIGIDVGGSTTKIVGFRSQNGKHELISPMLVTATDAITTNGYSNKDFLYSLFDEFYGQSGVPYGCRSVLYDDSTLENLTMGTARIYTIIILTIPAAIAVLGVVVIRRRKNR